MYISLYIHLLISISRCYKISLFTRQQVPQILHRPHHQSDPTPPKSPQRHVHLCCTGGVALYVGFEDTPHAGET